MTRSEFSAFAISSAISKDSISSGFGDFTVEKLPSGIICFSTYFTAVYPAFLNVFGIISEAVPCREVKTIFLSDLFLTRLSKLFFKQTSINNSSNSLSIN